jgi:hypothetical protein
MRSMLWREVKSLMSSNVIFSLLRAAKGSVTPTYHTDLSYHTIHPIKPFIQKFKLPQEAQNTALVKKTAREQGNNDAFCLFLKTVDSPGIVNS